MENITIIGLSDICKKKNKYYCQPQLSNYFKKILLIFNRVNIVSHKIPYSKNFGFELESSINVNLLKTKIDFIIVYLKLITNSKNTLLFISLPIGFYLWPIYPILRYVYKKKLILYIADDLKKFNNVSKYSNKITDNLRNSFLNDIKSNCGGIIVRGKKYYKEYKLDNRNCIITYPLTYLFPLIRLNKDKLNTIKLGYLGRLTKRKGIFCLLAIFKKISNVQKNSELHVSGDGDLSDLIIRQSKTRNITRHNVSNMDSLIKFMNNINILVVPSQFSEGVPRVIHEALMCGKFVIATNIGGIKNEHSSEILISDSINSTSIYKTILSLQNNLNLQNKLRNSITKYISKYNNKNVSEQHIEFIKTCVQ